VNIILIQIITW